MKKVAIIYASMTGNTENIAHYLGDKLSSYDVKQIEMDEIHAGDLSQYDGILIGSYTYGDGDLPFESEIFYDELDGIDLKGRVAGCFGSGDTAYDHFCAAVDHFQEKVVQCGMDVVDKTLKIELSLDTPLDIDNTNAFMEDFIKKLDA